VDTHKAEGIFFIMLPHKMTAMLHTAHQHSTALLFVAAMLAAMLIMTPSTSVSAANDNTQVGNTAETVLNFADARHLLLRTSFAPLPEDIKRLTGLTRKAAVDLLLDRTLTVAKTPEPEWLAHWKNPDIYKNKLTNAQVKASVAEQTQQRYDTKLWWMHEIRTTPSPLTEKMVMFWHNYFTIGMSDILSVHFVFRHNTLLRRHAFGNFRDMLRDVSTDPGFMKWLNIDDSPKTAPNENFAREIMELYSLGLGNYTEQDIIEVARALTGWKIDLNTGKPYFAPEDHDNGQKTILGQTGNFGLDEVIDILMQQDAAARYVVGRLWAFFVSHENPPDEAEVARLANVLRDNDYEIRPLMRALLLSDGFWAAQNRGNMFKSHMDLVLGTSRRLNVKWGSDLELIAASAHIGQDILDHGSVAGWPVGRGWVDTATLPQRIEYVTDTLDEWAGTSRYISDTPEEEPTAPKTFIDAWGNEREVGTGLRQTKHTEPSVKERRRAAAEELTPEQVQELARSILARPPLTPLPDKSMTRAQAMRALMLDPAYQFK